MDVTGCNVGATGVTGVTGMKGLGGVTGVSKEGNGGEGEKKREGEEGKISTDGQTCASKVVQEVLVDLKRELSLWSRF